MDSTSFMILHFSQCNAVSTLKNVTRPCMSLGARSWSKNVRSRMQGPARHLLLSIPLERMLHHLPYGADLHWQILPLRVYAGC